MPLLQHINAQFRMLRGCLHTVMERVRFGGFGLCRGIVIEHCLRAGGAWPYGQAAPFQSHQQACMDGFQRFLGQDSPRAATAAAAAAPTLPEVSADQQPTRTQPMGPTEAEQEPRQRPDSATGPQKAASLPSMLRPIARTAPVPLTGLYGKVQYFYVCAQPQMSLIFAWQSGKSAQRQPPCEGHTWYEGL